VSIFVIIYFLFIIWTLRQKALIYKSSRKHTICMHRRRNNLSLVWLYLSLDGIICLLCGYYLSLYISVFIIWTLILFLFFLQHWDKKYYYIGELTLLNDLHQVCVIRSVSQKPHMDQLCMVHAFILEFTGFVKTVSSLCD
jgi:hypothetical protein